MSGRIDIPNKASWSGRFKLLVQIIKGLNPLMNIRLNYSASSTTATISYSTESVVVTVPDLKPQITSLEAQIAALESRVYALENP